MGFGVFFGWGVGGGGSCACYPGVEKVSGKEVKVKKLIN